MPTWTWIAIAVLIVAAAVVLGVALAIGRRRRSARLKRRFGPEYEHTVTTLGGRPAAERELAARERQHDKLDLRPLDSKAHQRFSRQWDGIQTAFVDDPVASLDEADALITDVMRELGYPVDDFDQRAADVSVNYPEIVENYRAAHAVKQSPRDGSADTEQRRQAFVDYRALFDSLLTSDRAQPAGSSSCMFKETRS